VNAIFLDGDFPSKQSAKGCRFHCSPTCHPAQIGPEWVYGCLHPEWPENKAGDFCPIVRCGAKQAKCEFPGGYKEPPAARAGEKPQEGKP